MANRGMSAAMLAEIAKDKVRMVHLIKIGFSTPDYLTTAHKDIVHAGNTYLSLGGILEIGAIKESANLRVNSFDFELSGVDQSYIAIFLSENVTNQRIEIHLGFLDANGTLIASPVNVFSGLIDNFSAEEDSEKGTATIKINAVDHWADWERVAGRRTNDTDQQSYYTGDKGLEFSAVAIKTLLWGVNDK